MAGRPYGFGKFRGLRELNLTDEQRQQTEGIVQRHLETVKAQRERFRLGEKRAQGNLSAEDGARPKRYGRRFITRCRVPTLKSRAS